MKSILCTRLYKFTFCEFPYLDSHLLFNQYEFSIHNTQALFQEHGKVDDEFHPSWSLRFGACFLLCSLPPGGHWLAAHPCSFTLIPNPACFSLKPQCLCLLSPFFSLLYNIGELPE